MDFFEAVKSVFSKYVQVAGRAPRSEYWYFVLFCVIVGILLSLPDASILGMSWGDYMLSEEVGVLSAVLNLAVLIPSLTVSVRRLHDVDRSGWWLLIIITGIGVIPLIYWICKASDEGDNSFGSNPLTATNTPTATVHADDFSPQYQRHLEKDRFKNSQSTDLVDNPRSSLDQEKELMKVDDMFKKSIISEDERTRMRNKILGLD